MLSRGPLPSRGVTLVEIAVTLALVSILLMAAAPGIAQYLRNTQIRNVATSIHGGLQRARNEALRRNRTVRFSLVSLADPAVMDNGCALSAEGVSWVVSLNSPAGKCGNALSETADPMLIEHQAGGADGRNVDVSATSAGGATPASSIAFDGFGRVSAVVGSPLAVIDVDNAVPGNDFRALRIVISNGGNIRMCEPKVTDASDPRRC